MADELSGALGNLGQALTSTASIAGSAGASIRNALSMDDVQKGLVNAQKQIYDLQRGLQGTSISAQDVTRQFRSLSSAFTDLGKSVHGYNLSLEDTAKMMHSFYGSVGGMMVAATRAKEAKEAFGSLGKQLIATFRDDAPAAAKNLMTIMEKIPMLQDAIMTKSVSTKQMMAIYSNFGLEAMQFVQRWQAQTTPAMEQTQKLRDMFASLKAMGEKFKINFQVENEENFIDILRVAKSGIKIAGAGLSGISHIAGATGIAPGAAVASLGMQAAISLLPRALTRLWSSFTSLIGALDRNTASNSSGAGGGPPNTHWSSGRWAGMPAAVGIAPGRMGLGDRAAQWNAGQIAIGGRLYDRRDYGSALGSRAMGVANISMAVTGAIAASSVYNQAVKEKLTERASTRMPTAADKGKAVLGGIGAGLAQGAGIGVAVGSVFGAPAGLAVGAIAGIGLGAMNAVKGLAAFKDAVEAAKANMAKLGDQLGKLRDEMQKSIDDYNNKPMSPEEKADAAAKILAQQREETRNQVQQYLMGNTPDRMSAEEIKRIENFMASHPVGAKAYAAGDTTNPEYAKFVEKLEKQLADTYGWGDAMMDSWVMPMSRFKTNQSTRKAEMERFGRVLQGMALNSLDDSVYGEVRAGLTGSEDYAQGQKNLAQQIAERDIITKQTLPSYQAMGTQYEAMLQMAQNGGGPFAGAALNSDMTGMSRYTGKEYQRDTEVSATWDQLLSINKEQVDNIKKQTEQQQRLLALDSPGSATYNTTLSNLSNLSTQLIDKMNQAIAVQLEKVLVPAQTQIIEGRASSELASMGAGVDWMGGMRGGAPMWANITGAMGVSIAGMQQELDVMRDKIANPTKYRLTEKQVYEERQKAAPKEVEIRRATLENQLMPLRMQGEYLGAESGSLKAIFDRIMSTSGYSTKDELKAREEMIAVAKDQAKWAKAQYEWYLKNGAPGGPSQVFQAYQAMVQAQQNVGLQEWETQKRQYEKSLMGLDFAESMRQLGLTKMQTLYRPMSEQMPLHLEGLDILREKIQEFANLMNMIADKDSPQWYDAATKLTNANKEYYSQLDYIRNSWEQQLTEMSFNLPTGSYTMGQEGPSKYQMFGSGYYTYRNLFNAPAESGGGIGSYDMLYGGFMGAGLAQLNRGQDMKSLIGGNTFGGATNSVLGGEMGPYLGPAGSAQPGRTATSANLERIISNDTNKYLKSIDKSLQTITAYSYTGY